MYTTKLSAFEKENGYMYRGGIKYLGCELHNNCFTCPYKDCIASGASIYKWVKLVKPAKMNWNKILDLEMVK